MGLLIPSDHLFISLSLYHENLAVLLNSLLFLRVMQPDMMNNFFLCLWPKSHLTPFLFSSATCKAQVKAAQDYKEQLKAEDG